MLFRESWDGPPEDAMRPPCLHLGLIPRRSGRPTAQAPTGLRFRELPAIQRIIVGEETPSPGAIPHEYRLNLFHISTLCPFAASEGALCRFGTPVGGGGRARINHLLALFAQRPASGAWAGTRCTAEASQTCDPTSRGFSRRFWTAVRMGRRPPTLGRKYSAFVWKARKAKLSPTCPL